MENTLSFNTIHKSIIGLPDVTLPKLVVLTGRNGSGKTHLLEAIKQGFIKSTLAPKASHDIQLFDWNSIIPKDTGIFHPHQYQNQRSTWFQSIRAEQESRLKELRQQGAQLGLPMAWLSSLKSIQEIDKSKLLDIVSDPNKAGEIYHMLRASLDTSARSIYDKTQRNISDDQWRKLAPQILQENPLLFLEPSESKFFNHSKLLWGDVDVFQQAFGRVFSNYRDLMHQNDRLEKYPPKDDNELKYLNEQDFVLKYGEPPWSFVNKILEVCNLDFRVEPPPLHEITSYEPKLSKLSKEVEMRFQDLSSGEKVLMSFALCLYNAQDDRQETNFPKLLLLDEIDAPLHPSMVLSLLKTIQEVLVKDKGVSVILTTHSPSTVALAPEESLYEMNPTGPRIDKITRSRALSLLTAGVPTLSVSFDGRRQVFVESKTDAAIYEKLYQKYKSYVGSERSLSFIEIGKKDDKGIEMNSGCAQVERIVEALINHGNSSVFGLIDWDGDKKTRNRIHVLSPNIRDGIESLVFDPCILAATVIKESHNFCVEQHLIEPNDRYVDIRNWDKEKWQAIVDSIQKKLIDSYDESQVIQITYMNKIQLSISTQYLHMDDHKLEEKIMTIFGFLKPKNNKAGGLMNHIIDSVLGDYPELLPNDLIETFNKILNFEL